jgi:hypothetical protein
MDVSCDPANRLPPACGVDVEHIGCPGAIGQNVEASVNPESDAMWVDNFYDTLSYLIRLKEKELNTGEHLKYSGHKVVHSVANRDDLAPPVFQMNL